MARVLVVGGGGREHALAWKLAQSPHVKEVLVAPGNDGMRGIATLIPANDVDAWAAAASKHAVDLVVVGPEAPLVDGLADRLRADGFAVFGPDAVSAVKPLRGGALAGTGIMDRGIGVSIALDIEAGERGASSTSSPRSS